MSFNIGLSGLSAASDDINITGNNIANVSTTGFKKSRAEFGDVYAASILGGGRNQHGSGVQLQNIGQDFSQGNISFTGKPLDMAINGKGFFVLSGSQGTTYSRAGAFGTDNEGNVVNSLGERLQGFAPTSATQASGGSGPLTDLVVTTGEIDPQATTRVESIINLDAEAPPSSIVGSNIATNEGRSSEPQFGVLNPRAAQIFGMISPDGTDFSGTTPAEVTGSFNINNGLDFTTAGGLQQFPISVNGGGFQNIDLSGADTADGAALVAHVQAQLDAALAPPNNVVASIVNNRLMLETAQVGANSSISIGTPVEGLAQNIVTAGAQSEGKTAPPTGFTINYDGARQEVVIDEDFTNVGPDALERGGGIGSGNEALEDHIQNQINASPSLSGKIDVSINNDGLISFSAVEAGEHNLTVDPRTITSGSINFDQVVSFQTDRRAGNLDVDALDFTAPADTSFTIRVGSSSQQILLADNYNADGAAGGFLGNDPESGLEAMEDEIQRQINTSDLEGKVRVSIGADGDIVFELIDPNETSLEVVSDSTTPQSTGSVDVSQGFNFDGGAGGTPYTFTVAYSVDGNPVSTSNAITIDANYSSAQDLINGIQNAIDTDPNFGFNNDTREVEVNVDPVTGFLVIDTAQAGPLSQLTLTVTAPGAPDVIQDTGGAVNGTGPATDFDSYVSFIGDEFDSTGTDAINNGFTEEVIEVVDVNNRSQLVNIPEGASAHEVAQLFSSVDGVTATATSVAYITGTNRGDPLNVGVATDGVEPNLPLRFNINGHTFVTDQVGSDARIEELANLINNSSSNLTARVVRDAIGDRDVLEVTENNGLDLTFSGGTGGVGSVSVIGSERDPITGEPVMPGTLLDQQQLSNLGNLNQDAIVIGGTVDFVLEEGVTFADADADLDDTDIPATSRSIFGDISDPTALTGTEFELNQFDPDNPDTYYRSTAVAIYDSLGNQHTLSQYFVRERQAEGLDVLGSVWSVYSQIDGEDIGFDPANPTEPTLAKATVQFDQNGRYKSQNNDLFITNWTPRDSNGDLSNAANGPEPGLITNLSESNTSNFEIDLSNLTQFGGSFAVNSNTQDGYTSGQLVGLDVDDSGIMFARFSNGQSQILGEVALANFENAEGLENLGGTRFAETVASGSATPSAAGTAGLGAIQSGALEDSNVDLSDQLVHMIIAQRNFQASAQIIEAADTTTQTIINL